MKNVSVSVVIPCYNSSDTIERAVESVFSQTVCPSELIMVNDCSPDNGKTLGKLYEIKNKYEDIFLIKVVNLTDNQGAAGARNAGLCVAAQDFIAFLDADDKWNRYKLEKQIKTFQLNPNIGLVGTTFNGTIYKYFYLKKFKKYTEITLLNLIFKNFFQPSTVIIKKDVLDTVGYFDSNQRYAEEGNYFIRIASQYKCYLLNESLLEYGNEKVLLEHKGLSFNLAAMEKGELNNLKMAYTSRFITYPTYLIAIVYSYFKYIVRVIVRMCKSEKVYK